MEGWEGVGSWKMGWGMGGWGEAHKRKWGGTRDGPMKLRGRRQKLCPHTAMGRRDTSPAEPGRARVLVRQALGGALAPGLP